MGYISKLCIERDITLENLAKELTLDFNQLSDIDIGLANPVSGVYFHKIREYFNLDRIAYYHFMLERNDRIQRWHDGLTDEINATDESRNAFIAECMGDDNYQSYANNYTSKIE